MCSHPPFGTQVFFGFGMFSTGLYGEKLGDHSTSDAYALNWLDESGLRMLRHLMMMQFSMRDSKVPESV